MSVSPFVPTTGVCELSSDLVIIGGGMVGAAAACRLAAAGLRVILVESSAPEPFSSEQPRDRRVSAISPASIALLEECGVWEAIVAMRTCPYTALEAWEKEGFSTRFDAAELGVNELGHIVENRLIQLALWQKLDTLANVTLLTPARIVAIRQDKTQAEVTLDDGRRISTRLIIGADGAQSQTRQLAHIALDSCDYEQRCLLINVRIAGGQQAITWQHFTPEGPRAFLPLSGPHASLVWYDTPARIAALEQLGHDALAREIRAHFPTRLPEFELEGWGSFTLTKRHARHYVAGRVVLLGDAAHTIHPLAGQGVNLGFKDVADLCERIAVANRQGKVWDDAALLEAFELARRRDNLLMQSAMDLFYHVFGNEVIPLYWLRNAGLWLANRAGMLKRQALRYALGL